MLSLNSKRSSASTRESEAAWRREIELRVNELEAGEVNTVPWKVVKDRLAQRVRNGWSSISSPV